MFECGLTCRAPPSRTIRPSPPAERLQRALGLAVRPLTITGGRRFKLRFARHGLARGSAWLLNLAVVSDEVHLWEVLSGERLARIPRGTLDLESRLEEWLAADI